MAWLKASLRRAVSPRRVYADYAALTPVDPAVAQCLSEAYKREFAAAHNASALHVEGVHAQRDLAAARSEIARIIGVHADELVFTSGGTESNNMALVGVVNHLTAQGKKWSDMHIIISAIEHSSIRETARALAAKGVTVDVVAVDQAGLLDIADLKKKLRTETVLVSVMAVNNEIGTVQPLREVVRAVKHVRSEGSPYPLIHTDACQAAAYAPLAHVQGLDLITFDAQKMYGPRGIGALVVKRGVRELLEPIFSGGGQEYGLRSGTEPVPQVLGFAAAWKLVSRNQDVEIKRVSMLRELLVSRIEKEIIPLVKGGAITGHALECAPHIVHCSLPGIDTEMLVFQLDAAGIACSTKSSCLRDEASSYVMQALGAGDQTARSTLRISIGRYTKVRDIHRIMSALKKAIHFQLTAVASYVGR